MEVVVCPVGVFEVRVVRSRCSGSPIGQISCHQRLVFDRNHKWLIYYLFAALDIVWAIQVIESTTSASSGRYVLSYGQVRLCS